MLHDHSSEVAQALPHSNYTECHFVSERLECDFGWCCEEGAWLADDGSLYGLHVWNRLPDGCILDATASQLGDPTVEVSVVSPGEPGYDRYLPWWSLTHAEHRELYLGIPHCGATYAHEGELARARTRVPPAGRHLVEEPDPDYLRDC